jgi:ATP-binding cassette, subfamily B, multidrug efflux pump
MPKISSKNSIAAPLGIEAYVNTITLPQKGALLKNLKKFFSLILLFKGLLFAAVVASLITAACTVISPRLVGAIVDWGLKDRASLTFWCSIFLLAESARLIIGGLQSYLFVALGQHTLQEIRVRLYRHFLNLPLSTLDRYPSGALISRLTTDVTYLADLFQSGIVKVFQDVIVITCIFVSMFYFSPLLAFFTLFWLPVLLYVIYSTTTKLFNDNLELKARVTSLNAFLSDAVYGAIVVKLFQKEEWFTEQGAWLIDAYNRQKVKLIRLKSILRSLVTFAIGLGITCCLAFGSLYVNTSSITPGLIITFVTYLLYIIHPLINATLYTDTITSGFSSLERIFEALEWETEEKKNEHIQKFLSTEASSGTQPPVAFQELKFQDVSFAYNDEQWILRDISVSFFSGQKIGIVGATGSGKSTFVKLLLRFYDPQQGAIVLDNKPLSSYPMHELRRRIGYVQQDSWFFTGTILENITLWESDQNHYFFKNIFPDPVFEAIRDLNKKVEHFGTNLSSGTKQILSFARTLYQNPSLCILDEASAHVDPAIDAAMTSTLQKYASNAIVLTIAHRLSSVINADTIIVLSKGRIVESGKHSDLLEAEGLYAHMYRLQSQGQ